jgi:hypothetical protein
LLIISCLLCKGEDPNLFEQRIDNARFLRQKVEAQMRFNTYVESRPQNDLPTMPSDVAERIMYLTAVGIPGKFVQKMKGQLEDARKHYVVCGDELLCVCINLYYFLYIYVCV